MKKARVIGQANVGDHCFNDGDIIELISMESGLYKFARGCLIQELIKGEFEFIEDNQEVCKSDDFTIAIIDGKRYKCFPMDEGE